MCVWLCVCKRGKQRARARPPATPQCVGPPSQAQVLPNAAALLAALPSAPSYERSYMHRDVVTHVAAAPGTAFFVTASADGHVKFWKKVAPRPPATTATTAATTAPAAPSAAGGGIEFAKHYRAHLGPVAGLAVSADGARAATWDREGNVKIFDVAAFDMCAMLKLAAAPTAAEWVGDGADGGGLLAVGEAGGGVAVYDVSAAADAASGAPVPVRARPPASPAAAPVVAMRYLPSMRTLVLGDGAGVLDYWRPTATGGGGGGCGAPDAAAADDDGWPSDVTTFALKSDADLYALAVARTAPRSIDAPPAGDKFAVTASDGKVRLFRFATGTLVATYDESPDAAAALQAASSSRPDAVTHLDAVDFGRRLAVERELREDAAAPPPNAAFDESGSFLIFGSLHGVKIVNTVTHRLAALLGRDDGGGVRFLRVALFQGAPRGAAGRRRAAAAVDAASADPTLLVTGYRSHRFYVFTRREPEEGGGGEVGGRDVLNEKPRPEDLLLAAAAAGAGGGASSTAVTPASGSTLPTRATLHTTVGDITFALFPDAAPRAVENFTTHGAAGYYDGTVFHRVIKGFMIQGGDPTASGSGGSSIWGRPFEDEVAPHLRHDRPFTLAMANAGPGTNGSQFYVTTVATPWLDGKHTVFGRVVRGADVVQAIEKVRTGREDRPVEDVSIVSVTCGTE